MSLSALNLLGICLVDRAVRESGSSCLFLLVDCSAASWEENDDRNTWIPYRYPLCFFLKKWELWHTQQQWRCIGMDLTPYSRAVTRACFRKLFCLHLFTAPKICEYFIYGVGIAKSILQKTNEKNILVDKYFPNAHISHGPTNHLHLTPINAGTINTFYNKKCMGLQPNRLTYNCVEL